MLFDKLCKVAEREIPQIEKKLRSIKLFHFPGKPHEFLPKEIDEEIVTFLREQFMLPFQSVAIEDDAGLVILEDIERNAKGINCERSFIDVTRLNAPDEAFRDEFRSKEKSMKRLIDEMGMLHYDPIIIGFGAIEAVNWINKSNFLAQGRLDRVITAFIKPYKKKHIYSDYDKYGMREVSKEIIDLHLKSATTNAMTALQEVLYANTPSRFILEIAPSKTDKKAKKNNKISRSHNRPKYILLTPKEIRTIIKEDTLNIQTGRKSPIVHERRAHPRTFHSPKFTKMQGKTIMIPAKWIGVSEKTIGNKHYKVMLDM